MAYVAARGGERAIEQAERLFRERLGPVTPERVAEIGRALPHLVDRVMGEASLWDEDLAALALAQTGGDLHEAVLVLRAWRTTQPRLEVARVVEQGALFTHRRISAAFKDIPGGQVLGPTLDYAHRLLATEVLEGRARTPPPVEPAATPAPAHQPSVAAWQAEQGLLSAPEPDPATGEAIPDVTREPLLFPAARAHGLQSLARAETGGVLALGYAAQRGYGQAHPTVNELRLAEAEIVLRHPCGTAFSAGRVRVSQAEVVSKSGEALERGFAATLGWNEVKVIAAATLDLNMAGAAKGSATEEEFVLYHTDGVEASGFCIHFKLPHHVTFQSSLDAMRDARRLREAQAPDAQAPDAQGPAAEPDAARTDPAEPGAEPGVPDPAADPAPDPAAEPEPAR